MPTGAAGDPLSQPDPTAGLADYVRLRLADLRADEAGELWAVFVDCAESLPDDMALPLEDNDQRLQVEGERVGFMVCDRAGDHAHGDHIAHALTSGSCAPDLQPCDSWEAATWAARRYRAALGVGEELNLDEATAAWQRRIEQGTPLRIAVADRVLVVVPEPAARESVLAGHH